MLRWLSRCLFPGSQARSKDNEATATWVATNPVSTTGIAGVDPASEVPAQAVPPPGTRATQPAVDSPAPLSPAVEPASTRSPRSNGAPSTSQPRLLPDTAQREAEVAEHYEQPGAFAPEPGTRQLATSAAVATPPPPSPLHRTPSNGALASPVPMAALTPISATRPTPTATCAAAAPGTQQLQSPQPQEPLMTPPPRPGPARQPFTAIDTNTPSNNPMSPPVPTPAFSFCTAVDYAAITPVLIRGPGATPSVTSSTSSVYATPCVATSTAASPYAAPSLAATPEMAAAPALKPGAPGTESLRRYVLDSGKVVGVNNTMRRYREEKPLRPPAAAASTPFQERVNRELRAEERVQQTLRQGQGRGRR